MRTESRGMGEDVLLTKGWLAGQPPAIRDEVMERGLVQSFAAREAVYRFGDPPGGLYALIRGSLSVSLAPPNATPRFVQFGIVGVWAGEGSFMTGEPRRAEIRAISDSLLYHLPLDAMRQMAARNPEVIRCFARITIAHFDVLARVIDDLLISDARRRIASVLHRAVWLGPERVPITQADLGIMANASRKQVNAALAEFERASWVSRAYRAIEVLDGGALLRYASGEDG